MTFYLIIDILKFNNSQKSKKIVNIITKMQKKLSLKLK